MPHRQSHRIELGSLLLGLVVGFGTNLVTGDVERWWKPLQVIATTAFWWLPALVVIVLGYELIRRWRLSRVRVWRSTESPYPGLAAFNSERASVFFGRDREVQECLTRLEHAGSSPSGRQLVLVGPSGSGKTSLMCAGVLPRLSRRWRVLEPIRPGSDPFNALALVLAGESGWQEQPSDLATFARNLENEARAIAEGAIRIPQLLLARLRLLRGTRDRIVIAVDQAEELLNGLTDHSGRILWQYLQHLLETDRSAYLAITIRPEHLASLQDTSNFGAVVPVAIGAMATDQMREAIIGPAKAAGVVFEDDLVDTMIAEATVGDALPLLSHLLHYLWTQQDGVITRRDYEQAGRVGGSIADYADRIYEVAVAQHGQDAVAALLLRCVAWDGERLVRRWLRADELDSNQYPIVEAMRDARLMVDADGGRSVGLVHEALLRHWWTLSALAYEVKEALRLRAHLEAAAMSWSQTGQRPDGLLRGQAIIEAEQVSSSLGASHLLACMIEQSRAEASTEAAARAMDVAAWAQQVRLTSPANAVTAVHAAIEQLDDRVSSPAAMTLWGLTTLPRITTLRLGHLADISTLTWSGSQLVTADRAGVVCRWSAEGTLLDVKTIDGVSRTLLSHDGTMVAAESDNEVSLWRIEPLLQVASRKRSRIDPGLDSFDWSTDGQIVAFINRSWLRIYEATDRDWYELCHEAETDVSGRPMWSPDGHDIAVIDDDTIALGRAVAYATMVRIQASAPIVDAAWSPNGKFIAALTRTKYESGRPQVSRLQVWRTDNGELAHDTNLSRLRDVEYVGSLAWSLHNETRLLVHTNAKSTHELMVFDLGKRRPRRTTISDRRDASAVAFSLPSRSSHLACSAEGDTIAVSDGRQVLLLDSAGQATRPIPNFDLQQSDRAAWLPDLSKIAVGTRLGAMAFDLTSGTAIQLAAFENELAGTSVAWSNTGQYLAASNHYGFAVWDVEKGSLVTKQRPGLQEGVSHIAWSPDGRYLTRASNDWWGRGRGELSVWDARDWTQVTILYGTLNTIHVAWSPDNKWLAMTESGNTIRIVDTQSWETAATTQVDDVVVCISWATDTTALAVGTNSGAICIVDPVSGTIRVRCLGPSEKPEILAWCPSGALLAVGAEDHVIYLWDTGDARLVAIVDPNGKRPERSPWSLPLGYSRLLISDMAWADAHTLRVITHTGKLMIWQLPRTVNDVLHAVPSPRPPTPELVKLRFDP